MVNLLEVDTISYQLGERRILDKLSFCLRAGDLVALLGPNGAGKTSLLRLLMGLARPSEGNIRLHGRPLASWSRRQLATELGYLPQRHMAMFPFTVREIVAMGQLAQQPWWRPTAAGSRAVEAALNRLSIEHLAERAYTELSGGEQQSVLIARTLAQGCRIILFDEPTSGLDYGQQQRLFSLFRQLVSQGYTVLASIHDPQQAAACFDLALLMRQGRSFGLGPARELLDSVGIAQLYDLNPSRTR